MTGFLSTQIVIYCSEPLKVLHFPAADQTQPVPGKKEMEKWDMLMNEGKTKIKTFDSGVRCFDLQESGSFLLVFIIV